MKPRFLFPSAFRYLGYLLAVPGLILGYFVLYHKYNIPGFELRLRAHDGLFTTAIENFTNELALTLVIIGLMLIAFSKVKREDELTARIRLYALNWAILINYSIYVLVTLFALVSIALDLPISRDMIGQLPFPFIVSVYNLFTPLLIFTGIFFYLLYRNKNEFKVTPVRYLANSPYHFLGKWISIVIIALLICSAIFHIESLEATFILLPISMMVWIFSKEKSEDEFIDSIRLEAMQIAIYVNYAILLVSNLLIYSIDFWMMAFINLVTIPLIFVCWFRYKIYLTTKENTAIKVSLL